ISSTNSHRYVWQTRPAPNPRSLSAPSRRPNIDILSPSSQAQYVAPLPHPRGVKDRIQAIDNLNLVFRLLQNENIRAVNISAVDIADGSVKLTLGLLWSAARRSPPHPPHYPLADCLCSGS